MIAFTAGKNCKDLDLYLEHVMLSDGNLYHISPSGHFIGIWLQAMPMRQSVLLIWSICYHLKNSNNTYELTRKVVCQTFARPNQSSVTKKVTKPEIPIILATSAPHTKPPAASPQKLAILVGRMMPVIKAMSTNLHQQVFIRLKLPYQIIYVENEQLILFCQSLSNVDSLVCYLDHCSSHLHQWKPSSDIWV
jgi:hypothetical protein